MSSGYECERTTITAFWIECSSLGRPCSVHSAVCTLSAIMLTTLSVGVNGISRFLSVFFHVCISFVRNSWLNGPAYDRNAVARIASPTSRPICSLRARHCSVQRSFSPLSPLMSAAAVAIFRRHTAAASVSRRLSPIAASYCDVTKSRALSFSDRMASAFDSSHMAAASLTSWSARFACENTLAVRPVERR